MFEHDLADLGRSDPHAAHVEDAVPTSQDAGRTPGRKFNDIAVRPDSLVLGEIRIMKATASVVPEESDWA